MENSVHEMKKSHKLYNQNSINIVINVMKNQPAQTTTENSLNEDKALLMLMQQTTNDEHVTRAEIMKIL